MNLLQYWNSLNTEQKREFSKKCGYSENYIAVHLVYKRKTPPIQKIKTMSDATDGVLSFMDLCNFFVQVKTNPKNKTPSGN